MADTDKLEVVVEKAHRIFDKRLTIEVIDLMESQGIDAVRKLLNENGINDRRIENQYLEYLNKIEELLNEEHTKRRFIRIKFNGPASLEFAIRRYDIFQVENISLVGAFVRGSFQQKIGDHCVVKLFPKRMQSYLKFLSAAKVVWKNDEGIGLEFTAMSHESYMFLQATLLYEAEDPLSIGAEFPEESPFEIKNREAH